MQLTSIILGAIALPLLSSASSAADSKVKHARVINECSHTVYLQSHGQDGSFDGKTYKLTGKGEKGKGFWQQVQVPAGKRILLSKTKEFNGPLAFDYNYSNGLVFYDMGSQYGNPFLDHTNKLQPHDHTCQNFNCGPGKERCYSNQAEGHTHVEHCAPTDLTMTLCA